MQVGVKTFVHVTTLAVLAYYSVGSFGTNPSLERFLNFIFGTPRENREK